MKAVGPCTPPSVTASTLTPTKHTTFRCCTLTQPVKKSIENQSMNNLERLLDPIEYKSNTCCFTPRAVRLGKRWQEYQGIQNWDGLLDPLDDNLRGEILRYGEFVEAAYKSFDFEPSSPTYAKCRFPKNTLLDRSGLPQTGYRVTKHLRATSGVNLPRWVEMAPTWMSIQSSWIGYVAVCQDKEEISRLGRRDVVIAFRGTATCLEWLENLRATLTRLPGEDGSGAMVERGFLSLYTSGTAMAPSLQEMVREEINRLLQIYRDEPISLTLTGHSLGAALATLAAYDIKTNFKGVPMVTVISFGGPRVGNRSFRRHLEKQGTKVLRIVNSDDLITKVPGFVIDEDDDMSKKGDVQMAGLPSWIQKRVEDTQWAYAEIGRELRLSSKDSPYLNNVNVATCHELKTYLHLVNGFVSSTCPFRATARKVLSNQPREKVQI
ncbi:phospholipase A(1) DAD1, chloroplastic-like [Mangifera indica]|uniref:phospholipase A(1) DAD1, chloroplastic-like n=1 Tax=Mangifera indica TaxID=29780 RepID=UPI001CF9EC1D|nr:phospholipase A(1) DAD1, chloroplastic-like [Mangifera indica]